MKRTLAIVLALSMTACSWAFVTPPPRDPPAGSMYYCTTGRASPVLDTLVAAPAALYALLGVAMVLSGGDDEHGAGMKDTFGGLLILLGGVPALTFGLSARYGYRETARCRDLLERTRTQPQAQPQPQPQPPVPTYGPPGGR